MYSIVLMAAMSSGPEASGFGGHYYNTCVLDACRPIRYGWVSCGCHGNYWHGCGGCWGCSGYGWPLSYGIYPPLLPYGGYGLYPVPPVPSPPLPGDRQATLPGSSSSSMPPGPGPVEPLPSPKEFPKLPMTYRAPAGVTASIVVEVPENAKVYIDENLMKSTLTRRVFTTPPLEPGEDYYYWVRVSLEEGGKTVEEVKKVFVRAGTRAETSFANMIRDNDRPAVANATRLPGR